MDPRENGGRMPTQQRLIVCLDGTWNLQDSSTNVLNHFNLVREGPDPKTGVVQRKYYHRGVGTGVLDHVTGGGFGFGLEQNVRDAYNWLVGTFCDGEDGRPADEIYVFGFSRGAYTARSLVGFISQCGLLRRGAPMTVTQLWQGYCILGRQREERRSAWNKLFGRPQATIRTITKLAADPWSRRRWRAGDLTANEGLLVAWSRRVRITYLGVYDTVGAIGWDALAIPGLRSKIALHNNMRPTTLIQHCRHALALDEHRSSFNHTAFLAFMGHDASELERDEGGSPGVIDDVSKHWERTGAMWRRKIEQRWFVGAHSNVGGGYENNRLAQAPLRWMFGGAAQLGLVAEPVAAPAVVTRQLELPRDSYAAFAPPLWTDVLRAKRNYRAIDPDPVPQARAGWPDDADAAAGFTLQTINEEVDPSVFEYWKDSSLPLPPNLEEYSRRKQRSIPGAAPAAHEWLRGVRAHVALVLWATLAASGLGAVDALVGLIPAGSHVLVACLLAAALALVDWSESRINFKLAAGWGGPRERAFLDAMYWSRALGFVLFLGGSTWALAALPGLGWRHQGLELAALGGTYWPVPVCAGMATLLLSGLRSRAAWVALVAGPAALALSGGLLAAVGWFASRLFPEAALAPPPMGSPSIGSSLAGQLLLLQFALAYLWRALVWVGEPLNKANLGSIVPLQVCPTQAAVAACLERWRQRLDNKWLGEDPVTGPAAVRTRELVRESLWRDIIGFIPVYTSVFVFGLWFADNRLGGALVRLGPLTFSPFAWLDESPMVLPWWCLIPVIALTADYLEDACHLRFCKLHEQGQLRPASPGPQRLLVPFSWLMSRLKDLAVLAAGVLTIAAVLEGTWLARNLVAHWRAKIAVLLTAVALLFALSAAVASGVAWARRRRSQPR